MAWIEKRGETYRINFRYAGHHFSRSLKTGEESKAETTQLRVEETLPDLERGRLQLPPDADLVTFWRLRHPARQSWLVDEADASERSSTG